VILNIIVCAKVVIDPEAPISTFRVDPEARRVVAGQGVPPVVSPYDENCLEAALRIKEVHSGKITVVSVGGSVPAAVLKKCLAVGADDLIILDDEVFQDIDGHATACVLAEAIKKAGEFDLVLTGRMAADTNAGQVGQGVAEFLGIPCVTIARKIELNDGRLRVERVIPDGYEVVEVAPPCLITVSHELGELRSPTLQGLMAARKQPVTVWKARDLGIDVPAEVRSDVVRLFMPEKKIQCDIVDGQTPEEAGANLALKLRQFELL
jgi:electron transfer flavoprotein beta subunit